MVCSISQVNVKGYKTSRMVERIASQPSIVLGALQLATEDLVLGDNENG